MNPASVNALFLFIEQSVTNINATLNNLNSPSRSVCIATSTVRYMPSGTYEVFVDPKSSHLQYLQKSNVVVGSKCAQKNKICCGRSKCITRTRNRLFAVLKFENGNPKVVGQVTSKAIGEGCECDI